MLVMQMRRDPHLTGGLCGGERSQQGGGGGGGEGGGGRKRTIRRARMLHCPNGPRPPGDRVSVRGFFYPPGHPRPAATSCSLYLKLVYIINAELCVYFWCCTVLHGSSEDGGKGSCEVRGERTRGFHASSHPFCCTDGVRCC